MSQPFCVVPSAYVILRRDNNVLLQLRQNTGYMDGHWGSGAAGHVEAGESVLDAARRESREELEIEIELRDLLPVCAMHRAGRPGDMTSERVDFFFTTTTWQGEPKIAEPSKSADLRWFPLGSALPPNVIAHERFVLDGLRTGHLPSIVTFGFDGEAQR